jgi:hypothetical protein
MRIRTLYVYYTVYLQYISIIYTVYDVYHRIQWLYTAEKRPTMMCVAENRRYLNIRGITKRTGEYAA